MRDTLGKGLGISIIVVLSFMLLLMPVLHYDSQRDSLFFLLTTLLYTVILYWPAHVSGAIKQPIARLAIAPIAISMVILSFFVASGALPRTSPIISFLQNYAGFFMLAGLILLAMVFLITHYFLFRFFKGWIHSTKAYTVGTISFLTVAFLFIFQILDWLNSKDVTLASLLGDLVTESTEDPHGLRLQLRLFRLNLQGIIYLTMLYFFVTLAPFYLVSMVTKRNFKVSPWMHVTYIFTGISGLSGLILVIATGLT